MLVAVWEFLTIEDLDLSFLLDERDDFDSIIVVRGTVDNGGFGCDLRYTDML
jgi:hypothetical protein